MERLNLMWGARQLTFSGFHDALVKKVRVALRHFCPTWTGGMGTHSSFHTLIYEMIKGILKSSHQELSNGVLIVP